MATLICHMFIICCMIQIVTFVKSAPLSNDTLNDIIYLNSHQTAFGSVYQNIESYGYSSEDNVNYTEGKVKTLNASQKLSSTNTSATASEYGIHIKRTFNSFLWYMTVIADPITAVLGLVGNTLSCIIIYRSGLDKSSNILLFVLGLADCVCLMGAINIGNIVSFFPMRLPDGISQWEYPFETSNAFYIVCTLFLTCNYYGIAMSAAVCTLITLERVLAVYLPLHFKTLVTPTRTWVVVTVIALVWLPVYIYMTSLYQLLAVSQTSYMFAISNYNIYSAIETYYTTPIGNIIPFFLVVFGSVLISIRVSMASRKRQQMQNSLTKVKKSSSRTTRTLLAVCVLFSVTKSIGTVIWFVPIDPNNWDSISVILFSMLCYRYLHFVNSSCNFFIYVAFNNQFRKTLLEILCHRGRA